MQPIKHLNAPKKTSKNGAQVSYQAFRQYLTAHLCA
jgi:hypothetical protein